MKILIFCLFLSFVLHLLALGTLSLSTPSSQTEIGEVVDLTVVSPAAALAPASKSPPTKIISAQAPAAPSASAPSADSQTEQTSTADSAAAGSENFGDDSTPVVGWSEITHLPKVKHEVKAQYPAEAKKAGIDGPVLLEILIDREGQVRQVTVISGPGHGLNESAVAALKSFEFQPAFKGKESVAVKIRYTYRFKLEVN
ncbi:TonB family protein [Bdellovibrio bacteriovorus]|uniref:energy transducer TonB n=1 Tax=Bdellovibrio bacteriovorus TaxID=959 RepID=UPI0021D028A1|nr:energy transducer TonB [Bdellovibrio bacteriovorus]UXR64118.1 TonB family protein [Bdellovibrio bacteriovorus]